MASGESKNQIGCLISLFAFILRQFASFDREDIEIRANHRSLEEEKEFLFAL